MYCVTKVVINLCKASGNVLLSMAEADWGPGKNDINASCGLNIYWKHSFIHPFAPN